MFQFFRGITQTPNRLRDFAARILDHSESVLDFEG
jgi:hypothetical protein